MTAIQQAVPSFWQIRRATEADSEAIASFQDEVNRPRRSDSVISEYFIAESCGVIAGGAAVRAQGSIGYLYGLAVGKRWRRRGIGHALTQRRLDWLRETGAQSAFVLAMFWNIRFFERHGFELANRKKKLELVNLHQDFTETWTSRSALLMVDLLTKSASSSTNSCNEALR